jgi:predicted NAD/FAD-dependent oxidoreductase
LVCDGGDAIDVDVAIVATPAEQATSLLAQIAPDLSSRAGGASSAPCWTLMLAFSGRLTTNQDCWRGDGIIGWAARNSAKPGRTGPESWVVQAGPDWSKANLEADADRVAEVLKDSLFRLTGAQSPPVIGEAIHRWRFARSGAEGSGAIYDHERRLGLCGDWLIGPRVEAAWRSGATLAETILSQPGFCDAD